MPEDVRNGLAVMLDLLESFRLEVALAPCKRRVNEGGCIRVVISKNPFWYRRFCAMFPSSRVRRKFDTKIRRKHIANVIRRLLDSGVSRSQYAKVLKEMALSCRNLNP